MRILTSILFLGLVSVSLNGCMFQQCECSTDEPKAKNIILLIGDGMGLSQVSSSLYLNKEPSNFTRFTHTGLIRTSSASHKITDSAAGATAFSTGKKTYNGAIGIDASGISQPTFLELAKLAGLSTGVLATSSLTHATPASFYAHTESRVGQEEIARQLFTSDIDFFAGGGLGFLTKRKDGANYLDSLLNKHVRVELDKLVSPDPACGNCQYGYLLAQDAMPRILDGRGDFFPQALDMGLSHLSQNDKGFFLIGEGSQIDWGAHQNDFAYMLSELQDFDKAIGAALDFAEQDGNTLVIVTADHETGGFSLAGSTKEEDELEGVFSTHGHTATLIPVFAFGPGSEHFSGMYENTGIFERMVEVKNW